MVYFYMYLIFIFLFIFIYSIHRGKVEDYSHLKPYRDITVRELASIRYVEHRIRFSMEDMFSWLFYRVKKKKVYRFDNISNASLREESNSHAKKHTYLVFRFKHRHLEHELRISTLMYHYLSKMNIWSTTAVEFTQEASGEWHVLSVELEKREFEWEENSPIVKQKIDYIELYKLMHLRKNKVDSSLIATKVRRASKKERREFEFYTLGSIMLWLALFTFLMDFSVKIRTANFSEFFLIPMSLIALWYTFYFYNKRVWYWKNSKVYSVKGELYFDYNLYTYTLNGKELHLSRAWENFLNKHTQKSQSYFVEMDVLINRYEGDSFLSAYQPIRLKVLNSHIDYQKLPTRRHPLFLMALVVSLYYILFSFDYQEPLKKSFYGIKNIYEKEQSEFSPYKEVTFKAFPIPILDKHYRVMAYTLVNDNKTIQEIYRPFKKIEKSFDKVLQSDILTIKKEFQTFTNALKILYGLSDTYIKNEDAIYNYRRCHNPKECYDELLELYKVYNRIIVPPKLENIKGVVKPYFYISHHIKLIETDKNYNTDMTNTIIATIIWLLSVFFFVILLIAMLYRTILYIWGLSYYLFTRNRVDEVVKKSLEKVNTPSLLTPYNKQFELTLKMVIIMTLSFLGLIIWLSYNPNDTRAGTSFYAKRNYEERIRHEEWLKRIKKEESQLLEVLKSVSQKSGE